MGKYFKRYRSSLIVSFLLVALTVIVTLWQPSILSNVINKGIMNVNALGIAEPDMAYINKYGGVLVILGVIGLVAGVINTIIGAKVSQSIGADIREDLFIKIEDFSFRDVEKFNSGNLVVRMTNDVNQVQNLVMMVIQSLIRLPLLFLGAFILAMTIFPGLWWIIIAEVIAIVLIQMFVNQKTFPIFGKYQRMLDVINKRVKDNFIGARVVKSFVKEEDETEKFVEESTNLEKVMFNIGRNFSIIFPLFMLVGNLTIVGALWFSADTILGDMSKLGDLVSYITYLTQIMMALIIGGFMMMMAGRAAASITRINEIIKFDPTLHYGDISKGNLKGDVEFKDVSFTYHDDTNMCEKYILNNVSFKVKGGSSVGIVGATGSGKSTLVHLMGRLYDPTCGSITVDGVDLKDYSKDSLRENLSLVLQKPTLFSGTIKRNIKDGNLEASDALLAKSAEDAQAMEFISTNVQGFEGEVFQRGANFSGGQKQRLSIARGLIKEPDILILDDSTSALDAKSEENVKEKLFSEYTDSTKFIVAQKISSVIKCDKIIVLADGKLVGFDNNENLLKNCEEYVEIYESQRGAK